MNTATLVNGIPYLEPSSSPANLHIDGGDLARY